MKFKEINAIRAIETDVIMNYHPKRPNAWQKQKKNKQKNKKTKKKQKNKKTFS